MVEANYDEALVPQYRLPDPLSGQDGTPVRSAEDWRARRRPEILDLFAEHVYGRTPAVPVTVAAEPVEHTYLQTGASRQQFTLRLAEYPDWPGIEVLLYLPPRPAGVFLGLNFFGNHTVTPDPQVRITDTWVPEVADLGVTGHRAGPAGRGAMAGRWPIERILERGYGVATAYCGDLFPDHADGRDQSIAAVLDAPDWGALGAWAWGCSRIRDHLHALDEIPVAVLGHSRLGKAAMWAAAQDERFSLAISNNSGCTGVAVARRRIGETVAHITERFPYWFAPRYRDYAGREDDLPVDQHLLVAAIAPRPVHIASAQEDRWSDPRGEFLGGREANPVYALLGSEGLPAAEQPDVEQPVTGTISYHLRRGGHDVTDYDWEQYLATAERFLRA